MSERKQQILHETVLLLVTEGHVGCTMRAVARASGLTLGALQYHYPTRIDLIRGLAHWIATQTEANFARYQQHPDTDPRDLHAMVDFLLEDPLAQTYDLDTLFEQLWAMALVEPIIRELLDTLYAAYLHEIEARLQACGVETPRADALVILSMLEGVSLFVGRGRPWQGDAAAAVTAIHGFLDARYG